MNTTTARKWVALKNSYPSFALSIHQHRAVGKGERNKPDSAMRHESKPGLEYKRNDTRPVEQQTGREMRFHIMPADVVHDEWECM